ncbi:MAG: peptidoglycan DD-metalloendopeptidase family protein [Paracoccaceae bacterium]|nr:peptidoglycan DD-metalloendopeptidase family protein [Paracoccaceae bacterium]
MTRTTPLRLTLLAGSVAVLGACSGPLDFDLRGQIGDAFNTADAAQTATADRPRPDNRGVLSYPNYQVAVARRGDTLADVAARVGLPADELARFNGIKPEDPLRKGEIVALPRRVAEPSPATGAAGTGPIRPAPSVDVATLAGNAIDRAPATTPRVESGESGVEPERHKVARGETAFTIARLHNVTPRALAEWNGLDSSFTVREGQFLLIPVALPQQDRARDDAVTDPGSGSPTPQPPSASQPLPTTVPDPVTPAPAAEPAPPPEPVADIGQNSVQRGNAAMVMPLQGRIIREYSKGRNEGIDIAASAGTAVKAAASGRVAAITRDADNITIVVIKHPDDVLSVYTHLNDLKIQKGDAVSRGQTIGAVQPGNPAFLHFEVRKGFESVDPMSYLN